MNEQVIRKIHTALLLSLLVVPWGGRIGGTQSPALQVGEPENQGLKKIDEAIAALGGNAYLSVQDITLSGRGYQIFHGSTSGAGVFVDYIKYPDKERLELGKKKESILIYNGEQGWDIDYRAVRAVVADQMESYHRTQKYLIDRILRFDLKAKKYRAYYEGTEYTEATKYDVITLEDTSREKMSLLLNTSTHLPVALRYRLVDPKTKGVDKMEAWYGNFRSVQGVMTPFHRERIRNGERISETFVNEVKYNSSLPDSLFTAQGAESK
jgi:outer membrane lipoprotein-sorting protein